MGEKINMPTKEELYSKYVGENLRKDELASLYGASIATVSRWLSVHGIKKDKSLAQESIARTIREKYGSAEALAAQSLEKRKKTCLERYGVDNSSKINGVAEKIKSSLAAHYHKPSEEEFRDYYCSQNHSLEECAERYGVSLSTATNWAKGFGISKDASEVSECRKNTCMEKYGATCCLQNEEIKAKCVASVRDKYGVDNVFASDEIKDRIKKTNMSKYGVEKIIDSPKMREKMRMGLKNRWGVEYAGQAHASKEAVAALSSKETLSEFILGRYGENKPTIVEISRDLNCSETAVGHKINGWGLQDLIGYSTFLPEEDIKGFLEDNGIPYVAHDRKILSGKELDFYVPSKKIGIEFNGSYWHSEAKKDPMYHQRKSLEAAEKGVFVFHIFEYEWEDPAKKAKILGLLKDILMDGASRVVYARKTVVKEVPPGEKKAFLDAYHLQGNDRASVCYGIYDGDELLSVMSFCKPRFSKTADWEVSRYCSKQGVRVLGGAGKLFSRFVEEKASAGQKIISYSDISKTKGGLYGKLGFSLDHISKPNYVWWKKKEEIKSRYSCQMKNEDKIMHEQGYKRIFDSGNKVWVYSVK